MGQLRASDIPVLIKRSIGNKTPVRHSDGRSLYLIVRNGRGSWVYSFWEDGKSHMAGLGPVDAMSLAEARLERDRRALERRRQKLLGVAGRVEHINAPSSRRKPLSAAPAPAPAPVKTFEDACREYIAHHANEWRDRGSKHWAAVTNHCTPLHRQPVAAIGRDDLAAVLRPIWKGPTVGQGQALRGFAERVFSANGVNPNPATWRNNLEHVLSRASAKVEPRKGLPAKDMPALMTELAACTGPAAEVARALQLAILTGARIMEAVDADWSEVHLNGVADTAYTGPTWLIPAERMKQGREHAVPLTPRALALLGAPKASGRVFVTTGTASGAINRDSPQKLLTKLRPGSGATVHGMRSTMATWAQHQGFSVPAIELALSHQESNRTRRAYLRGELWQERCELMAAWSEYVGG